MLGEKATFPGPKSYGNSPFNLRIGSFSEAVIMYCVQKHIMGEEFILVYGFIRVRVLMARKQTSWWQAWQQKQETERLYLQPPVESRELAGSRSRL